MRMRRLLAVPAVAILFLAACGDDDDDGGGQAEGDSGGEASGENTGEVNLLSAVEPEEADAIQTVFDDLINSETDYNATIEASSDFEEQLQIRAEGGNLDVAIVPQPGGVVAQAQAGTAISLEDMGFDIGSLEDTFGEYFMSLGEFEGEHYGIPSSINLKSMIWYPKDDFDAAGYEVPETWDDLMALTDQIKADGGTPWCVGFESGDATGWPATDWIEDIMLRTAGTETYDQWVNHEIPFNDESVQNAAELFGDVMFGEGNVLGGAANTPALAFGDAPLPMFDNPPKCWLHRQASFINAFFPEDAEAGTDYDWFPFPPIDQEGTLFAGEFIVAFRDAPEVQDFMERFTSQDVQCAQGGEQASSRVSPRVDVGADCYVNTILADSSTILTDAIEAGNARFDASDLMPPEVGSNSFWTGMITYVQSGPDSLQGVLDDIEGSWPSS
jgi:alpha-glucoside transport system substrate-binding protein